MVAWGMRLSPGEPTGLGAALWRMGLHSARGRTIGRPFGKRLPILPVSRTSLGEMEEVPPAFQQVSLYGPWLLVQRRKSLQAQAQAQHCYSPATALLQPSYCPATALPQPCHSTATALL